MIPEEKAREEAGNEKLPAPYCESIGLKPLWFCMDFGKLVIFAEGHSRICREYVPHAEMEAFRNEAADKIFHKDAENSKLRQELETIRSYESSALGKCAKRIKELEDQWIFNDQRLGLALQAKDKEIGLLHEAIGQAEHREVNLRKALEDYKNHAHEVCLVWARDLEAKTRECEKFRAALEYYASTIAGEDSDFFILGEKIGEQSISEIVDGCGKPLGHTAREALRYF